ncbi:MAG TPA: RNA polymerase sigma factor [Gemmataceae bacterium]
MATTFLPAILENVQRRLRPSLSGVVTDAQLLERFLKEHDQAAFELLMWRHGPMVFGVCRRVLQHTQDAEDAFQATFLMLARKAASIGKRESVSGWLYRVAYRIALRARTQSARRGRAERPLDDLPIDRKSADPADVTAWRELRCLLDAELSQVPEKYRTAFILCHLEGKTCEEAAEHLGCPRGTVQSRVGRARERLRVRLARRGWLPASTPLAGLLEQNAAPLLEVSPVLIHSTVYSALLVSMGKTLAGLVSPSVLELMTDTLSAMRWSRIRERVILAVVILLASSATVWGMHSLKLYRDLAGLGSPSGYPTSSCHGSPTPQEP